MLRWRYLYTILLYIICYISYHKFADYIQYYISNYITIYDLATHLIKSMIAPHQIPSSFNCCSSSLAKLSTTAI